MVNPSRIMHTERGDWRAITRLWPCLWRYRYRIGIGLFFLILARLANISVPLVLKDVVDSLEDGTEKILITVPVALVIAYGLLRFLTVLFNEIRNVVFSRAAVQTIQHISMQVFNHLHALSLAFHLDRKTGALSRDVERGTSAVSSFMRMIVFSIVPTIFELVVVIVILWQHFEFRFALITLIMIFVYSIFTLLITRWRTRFRVVMNKAESRAQTRILDSLLNYETVKAFGNEKLEARRYDESLLDWVRASFRSYLTLSYLNVGQGLIVAVGLSVILLMAAEGVANGTMTLGDFVMINAFLIQLYMPLNFLGSIYRDMNHALVDMQRMFDLLDITPDIVEVKSAKPLVLKDGEIRFEEVNFGYQTDRLILDEVSFTVRGGSTVAVVGPSGSGKSTLSRLFMRFYDPHSGRITIDGQDIQKLTLESLRSVIGIVLQETVLFNDTIGYNIGYGRSDAGKDEIRQAARIAQLDQFIEQHPQGYDILVGERGLKLSGGEKQRVAIARAAIKHSRIMIFDEATSSLDTRSEKAIQHALNEVAKNATTLVIAHRLSTIVDADQIIVLDHGRIVEKGRHGQLLQTDGLYKQMWQMQKQQHRESV